MLLVATSGRDYERHCTSVSAVDHHSHYNVNDAVLNYSTCINTLCTTNSTEQWTSINFTQKIFFVPGHCIENTNKSHSWINLYWALISSNLHITKLICCQKWKKCVCCVCDYHIHQLAWWKSWNCMRAATTKIASLYIP